MRELNTNEIEEVTGAWLTVLAGAVIGGGYAAITSCISGGDSFWTDVAGGAATGALAGTGAGLLTTGVRVGSVTLKSVTGGITATGTGGALTAAQAASDG